MSKLHKEYKRYVSKCELVGITPVKFDVWILNNRR